MSETMIVHVRGQTFASAQAAGRAVYIGRANPRAGLRGSPFANPFKEGRDGSREEVIERYRSWLHSQPWLIRRARRELAGKVLGCWCKPLACHGDVLVELIEGKKGARANGR